MIRLPALALRLSPEGKVASLEVEDVETFDVVAPVTKVGSPE